MKICPYCLNETEQACCGEAHLVALVRWDVFKHGSCEGYDEDLMPVRIEVRETAPEVLEPFVNGERSSRYKLWVPA